MAFQVKSFREVLTLSKEKLDEALAPIRARSAKAKAGMYTATLEEKLVNTERQINEACAEKDLDFDKIIGLIDTYELTERKLEQANNIVTQLFPAE